jgi:hypothetical protein
MDHPMEPREPFKEPFRETAQNIGGSRLAETLETTKGAAQELGTAISGTAQRVTAAGGETLHSLAGTIRDRAPGDGPVAMAAGRLAEKLQAGGTYLQERGIGGAVDDLTVLIRRYPLQAILVGVGLGFLLARQRR